MEAADPAQSADASVAVQRAAKIAGGHQPESADSEPALHGGGRSCGSHRLCGSTAKGGVFSQRAGQDHVPDPGCHGTVGESL